MNISSLAFCLGAAACSLAFANTPVVRQEAPTGYSFLADAPGRAPGSQGQFFTLNRNGGLSNNEVFRHSSAGWQRVSPAATVQRQYEAVDSNPDGTRVLIAAFDPGLPVGGLIWEVTSGLSNIQTPANIAGYSPGGFSADGQVITGRGRADGIFLSGNIRTASGQWRSNAATNNYANPSPDGLRAFGSYLAADGQRWPAAWNLTNDTVAIAVPPRAGESPTAIGSLNRLHNAFLVSTRTTATNATQSFVYFANSGIYEMLPAPAGLAGASARSANADASLILGITSSPGTPFTPLVFAWTPSTGSLLLQDYLARFGVDFSGWASLETARVSLDGLTFWGLGQYQTAPGQTSRQAWTVTIPAPPAAPALLAAGLLACRRHRR